MESKRKICIVTCARSEYGLLRWVIDEFNQSSVVDMQLVVSGSHLSVEQGMTYQEIERDGYVITRKVDIRVDSSSENAICDSMSLCLREFSGCFADLQPNLVIVLGDRYELLPICSAALIHNIPIAHIAGGDITEGAIDNKVRNAVSMMSTYHFPGTEASAKRLLSMGIDLANIFVVGETNLDNFRKVSRWSRAQLADNLQIDARKDWVLCTYHSETLLSVAENLQRVDALSSFISRELSGCEVIITKANADLGGEFINEKWSTLMASHSNVHLVSSLGLQRYISMLSEVEFMMGNSSSGIFESPVVGTACINVGDRQKGRVYTENIFSAQGDYESLVEAWSRVVVYNKGREKKSVKNPYGDGYASERICKILIKKLNA